MEIYEALIKDPNVQKVRLERPLGTVRPDVSAVINGVPVAIEVQISNLSIENILYRTIEYHRKGVYVLWLLPWTMKLNEQRYSPTLWEKWVHAAYFGRVYYWTQNLDIVSYRFEPHLKSVPKAKLHSPAGKEITVGGYTIRSKRFRTPVLEARLNLVNDFHPCERYWWEGNGVKVPDAKICMHHPRKS